jgi:hypothetical protein
MYLNQVVSVAKMVMAPVTVTARPVAAVAAETTLMEAYGQLCGEVIEFPVS